MAVDRSSLRGLCHGLSKVVRLCRGRKAALTQAQMQCTILIGQIRTAHVSDDQHDGGTGSGIKAARPPSPLFLESLLFLTTNPPHARQIVVPHHAPNQVSDYG